MIGFAEYGEGEEMVAVLGHLDVVPAGEGWSYPPFGAEVHEGRIYGRGILDDKGPILGALFALRAIKESGVKLKRRVRIIFGGNEESGCRGVEHYLKTGEIPVAGFTPDAEYPIIHAEKGMVSALFRGAFPQGDPTGELVLTSLRGGTAPNVVPGRCRAVIMGPLSGLEEVRRAVAVWKGPEGTSLKVDGDHPGEVVLEMAGVSAHASLPEQGVSAIMCMVDFLLSLDLPDEASRPLNFLQQRVGHETDGRSLGLAMKDDESGALSLCLGTMSFTDGELGFSVDIRFPVTKTEEDVRPVLVAAMERGGFHLQHSSHKKPLFVSPDSPLIRSLQKVYLEETREEPRLLAIGGGTYAKEMPNIVAFGPEFPGQSYVIHQPDECWAIEDIIRSVKIMASAIIELAR
jgi:succinyl-diaminopimelate desuccinylase